MVQPDAVFNKANLQADYFINKKRGVKQMKIIVCKTYQEMSQAAADIVARQIKKKPDTVLGLATGSTPVGLYQNLIKMNRDGVIDFSGVVTFNLDEYVGLPKEHPCSYYRFMFDNLFDHINIKKENVHLPDGLAPSLEDECKVYEQKITQAGGIDLQVLGIGHNGHIGFNEPGTPFESVSHIVDLAPRTIQANSRFFSSPDEVPRKALSMGIKSIMHARMILFLASGKDKAEIVSRAFNGPVTTDVPASVLQLHPDVTAILDEDAASCLQKQLLLNI